jgi:hypothetical protein
LALRGQQGVTAPIYLGFVMIIRAYVDGFNLFYSSLKGTKYKWLDIVALKITDN